MTGKAGEGGGEGSAQGSFLDAGPSYKGHRERLRKRFMTGGADALPDYELLELVLFRAIPRRDTKELAKRLIGKFGSFAEVINAPEPRLLEIEEVGERVVGELKLIRAASLRLMRGEILERPALSSWRQVVDYCRAAMAFETREQFRMLFLDWGLAMWVGFVPWGILCGWLGYRWSLKVVLAYRALREKRMARRRSELAENAAKA